MKLLKLWFFFLAGEGLGKSESGHGLDGSQSAGELMKDGLDREGELGRRKGRTTTSKSTKSVVMVLTDDLDGSINGYNASGVAHMPQLNDRVARRGAVFLNYVVAYPLCSPSRSTMLTGRFTHNTRFYGNLDLNASFFHPVQERYTVNTWFPRAALVGKYMNGYHSDGKNNESSYATYIPPRWTSWMALQTVDYWGPRVNVDGRSVKFADSSHQTDVLARLAADWIRRQQQAFPPGGYFALITPHAPHDPYLPPARYEGTHVEDPVFDASFNMAEDLQKKLPGVFADLPTQDETAMKEIYKKRARCLFAVDDLVGAVLDALPPTALDEDTYFFFSSDNGYHFGHHRLPAGKREVFDHDIRVPLVVAGPGVKPGPRRQLVANYDLAPTWADLANLTPRRGAPPVDGRSFAAILRGDPAEKEAHRTFALQESYGSCEDSPHGANCTGRDQNSTEPDYLGLYQPNNFTFASFPKDATTMLFDDKNDPFQTKNVAASYADTVEDLLQSIATLRHCVGADTCP
mmetsp:Transcript_1247/g.4200  ORF Transcript_1247/g.4200 Transcript_1247/m.4200 type:complete len:518 (-) Transcript_1247:117-1670(-)|eukprot:CAMPEP_0118913830 /NCGR_PEP_ID=MMETSP1166-20130328/14458_1 /TAXON_ID=1104430 /ORGANISM="Chrysoreinhardia sp, Strain CCMP3193" /LENGTH=517 /DNA_ID=CAMNT_0006853395 /DNA_START=20 /DNA_END=1576 /DNA_ORIENTATION=-